MVDGGGVQSIIPLGWLFQGQTIEDKVTAVTSILVGSKLVFSLTLSSKRDKTSFERAGRCQNMSPVYWSTGGDFLAAPENKHINIMNVRGTSGYKTAIGHCL